MKLYQTNEDTFTKGIFHEIKKHYSADWLKASEVTNLETEYYLMRSGEKEISSLYYKLLHKEKNGDLGTKTALGILAEIAIRKYSDKWERLYEAFVETKYNPIENYNGVESETVQSKVTATTNGNNDIYGFNDEESTPTTKVESTTTTEAKPSENIRTLEKHGNIGVTSNQDMLNQEWELRKKNFYDSLFSDVDELLVSSIY